MKIKKKFQRFKIKETCSDDSINAYYAGIHEIDEGTHNYFIQQYFGINPPQTIPVLIKNLNLTSDCTLYCIRFSYSDSIDNNSDIKVGVGPIVKVTGQSKIKKLSVDNGGKYSLQVIKGIVHLFGVDRLEFSKAIDYNGKTAVFAAYRTGTANPVYYGDLTSQFPFDGSHE